MYESPHMESQQRSRPSIMLIHLKPALYGEFTAARAEIQFGVHVQKVDQPNKSRMSSQVFPDVYGFY